VGERLSCLSDVLHDEVIDAQARRPRSAILVMAVEKTISLPAMILRGWGALRTLQARRSLRDFPLSSRSAVRERRRATLERERAVAERIGTSLGRSARERRSKIAQM
jgi:hypothetical protein